MVGWKGWMVKVEMNEDGWRKVGGLNKKGIRMDGGRVDG